MKTIFLALRNLTRQKRRSLMLAIAIAFGFFVVTAIDGLVGGAVACLEDQIMQMMGGDVFIQGLEHNKDENGEILSSYSPLIRDEDYIEDVIKRSGLDYEYYSQRASTGGTLIFNNKKVMGNVYGCNFQKEKHLLDSLIIEEGKIEDVYQPDAMIITRKTADALQVEVGDVILYSMTTLDGQKNVGDFRIAVIAKDASLMSSIMLYANLDTINELIEAPKGSYNMFSVSLKNKSRQNENAQKVEEIIRADSKNVTSRLQAYRENPKNPSNSLTKQATKNLIEGTIYTVFSLNDAIPQIKTVVSVVHTVTTCILIVILLIVMVGISNTYRMILIERMREIGTMRAVGMTGKSTGRMFTTEAIMLSLFGAVSGFVLAVIVMTILTFVTINNESVSFFLHNGHLTYRLSFMSVIGKYIVMILLTTLAVRGTAKKASSLSPAQALR